MAIYKVVGRIEYTVMPNYHLKDDLTLSAKGLMSVVLALPEDWNFSIEALCELTNTGKHSLNTIMKELKKKGYLEIKQKHSIEQGRFIYEYWFYLRPKEGV